MLQPLIRLAVTFSFLVSLSSPALAQEAPDEGHQSVFSWPFVEHDMSTRGGTTEGPDLETVTDTTAAFSRLREDSLSKFERDRRAILAMAGTYRVSFDFLEIVGYAPDFRPARPYQSWGTEHVYVVEDDAERISLQHILIMSVVGEDGELLGPFVTKHWRQDWVYEDAEVHTFRGYATWAGTGRDEASREGMWSQTVWQVDDSPRYAGWGEWQHSPERSWWESGETWRPLPRREFSVRDDYDALIGTNTHIVLPTGWVHEQHNVKAVLAGPGEIDRRLAREIGVARYERVRELDTEPGDEYWSATAAFWGEVREYWERAMAEDERIRLRPEVYGQQLFMPLFSRAQAIADGEAFSQAENRQFVTGTIDAYRADPDESVTTDY
ncbi:MAG: DUF6607 family protein [Pseudomonadota bacterium]